MILLDGRIVAAEHTQAVKSRVEQFVRTKKKAPGLAVILVGDDPASQVYVNNKEKACEAVGIKSFRHNLKATTPEVEVLNLIKKLNSDPTVNGILVQMPVPPHISYDLVLKTIDPLKDVDGLTYENRGYAWSGKPRVKSCTPAGVIEILKHYKIEIKNTHAVVIGRSDIVGKPMVQLLLDENATVTICHSKTKNLFKHTQSADILVVAAGKPKFLGHDAVKKDAVVIDVGIHRMSDGKVCGDVNFDEVKSHVKAITPVPGGVGPMTIAMLLKNTLDLAALQGEL